MFCPNNKGGLYMVKNTGSADSLYVATSEGDFNVSNTTPVGSSNKAYDITYDYKTGISYVVYGPAASRTLQKVILDNDNKVKAEVIDFSFSFTSINSYYINRMAIYHSILFGMAKERGSWLSVYKIDSSSISKIESDKPNKNFYLFDLLDDSLSKNKVYKDINYTNVNDVFADAHSIYILFTTKGANGGAATDSPINILHPLVTVGGILKIKYELDGNNINFSDARIFGLADFSSYTSDTIISESYYTNHFYKPIKFVGFDGDNLYIADDGVQCKYNTTTSAVEYESNRNRMAIFNLENESLSFVGVPDSVKWAEEK